MGVSGEGVRVRSGAMKVGEFGDKGERCSDKDRRNVVIRVGEVW